MTAITKIGNGTTITITSADLGINVSGKRAIINIIGALPTSGTVNVNDGSTNANIYSQASAGNFSLKNIVLKYNSSITINGFTSCYIMITGFTEDDI